MLFSSVLFRKVFLSIQTIVVVFSVAILVFVVPYIEGMLYKNEERMARLFLNNIVLSITQETLAIDEYWKNMDIEHRKRLRDIVSLERSNIAHIYKVGRENKSTQKELVNSINQMFARQRLSDNGNIWIINKEGKIICHNDSSKVGMKVDKIRDVYGNYVYKNVISGTPPKEKGYLVYWKGLGHGIISRWVYFRYLSDMGWWIGAEIDVVVENEISRKEEQIISKIQRGIRDVSYLNSGRIMVLNGSYQLLLHSGNKKDRFSSEYDKSRYKKVAIELSKNRASRSGEVIFYESNHFQDKTGSSELITWLQYIRDYDWYVVLMIDRDDLYKDADHLKFRIILIIIAIILSLTILVTIFLRNIIRHIHNLADVSHKVGKGDLQQRSSIKREDEIGFLANSINQMIGSIKLRTDELNRLNEQYLIAKKDAEDATSVKSRFLTAVSHDLIQPLSAAKLLMEMLSRKNFSSEDDLSVDKSINSLESAERMIKELVEIAKLDSGQVAVKKETFCLDEVLSDIEDEFGVIAKEKGLELRVVNTRICLYSDKVFIRHIVQNLVSNALHYTEKGKVLLGVKRSGDKLLIKVCDSGPGISKEMQQKVFQEFTRGEAKGAKKDTHFGVGLSIVDKMSQMIGYNILLDSEVGKGTIFSVEIPFCDISKEIEKDNSVCEIENILDFSGKAVLCVDDDFSILDALDKFVCSNNGKPVLAQSMDEVKELFEDGIDDFSFIISDFHVDPENNYCGVDVISKVRSLVGTDLPAIIITGAYDEDVAAVLDSSSLEYHLKPINISKLKKQIAVLLER